MKLQQKLFSLAGALLAKGRSQPLSLEQRAEIEAAIESVVDGIEPKIRLVRGYQKKLQAAVITALAYIDTLVEKIPGPLDVNPRTFVSDPHVNAFFATPEELRNVFSASQELRAFFEDERNAELSAGCALLCLTEEEKTVLGVELAHGAIRRDVTQTAVNFSDHKVLSPAATEAETRRGLKDCIFNALVSHALQHILNLKSQRKELEDRRRILHARLRARQAQNSGLGALLTVAPVAQAETGEIEARLAAAEEQLSKIPASQDAPRDYLNEVKAILAHPEEFIRLKIVSFQLTRMGIKAEAGSAERAQTIELAEIEIEHVLRRVVVIVRYPRAEMLPSSAGQPSQAP